MADRPMLDSALARLPVLVNDGVAAIWCDPGPDGALVPERLEAEAAGRRARATPPMLVHGRATAARLGLNPFPAFDLLDLFAFCRPARFCLPTARGLLEALQMPLPQDALALAASLPRAARRLLDDLGRLDGREKRRALRIAGVMQNAGWPWALYCIEAMASRDGGEAMPARIGLDVWNELPEWADFAPPPPPDTQSVSPAEARERLQRLLGPQAEDRDAQADYAAITAQAFAPRAEIGMPELVLSEAGTGIGKTLGYIAPASVWAEKNGGSVWLSTYTKNLQRQLDRELDRLYPNPTDKATKVVVRKGRENYICLLNLEDAAGYAASNAAARPADSIALGLVARWVQATRDGDIAGGDFPAWIADLHGRGRTLGLTDQRGECIHAACPHYRKCFIERGLRRARRAEMVIANHALVMINAAQGAQDDDDGNRPLRYVFDEGHHLFDAADGAFAAHLTGREGMELRRWLRGPEGPRRSRARGLAARIGDLVMHDEAGRRALDALVEAGRALPGEGWLTRLAEGNASREEKACEGEAFLAQARLMILARSPQPDSPYGLECPTREAPTALLDAALAFANAISRMLSPAAQLAKALAAKLDDDTAELDSAQRGRLEGALRGLARRKQTLEAWRSMLLALQTETPADFVDWFALEREAGHDADLGLYRHYLDPMLPFADAVMKPAHGLAITSATLRDLDAKQSEAAPEQSWHSAEIRSGARHLPLPARRASFPSPFDYAGRTRIFVVTDVRRDDMNQVAAAYRELFMAAGGGGLGLFTAIFRLRAVQKRIVKPLADQGIALYAQHVDPLDNATLVDIFRAEEHSCLLGTDAMRDGVDVPGSALRLAVFDRVPWPRPDLLHKARRNAFGGQAYDDLLTRLKLKQAFGRLLRRADDYGVFVVLDAQLPSRLLSAFPAQVDVRRIGIKEAVSETRAFLQGMRGANVSGKLRGDGQPAESIS
ncbi:ATP-dependent DNA helicase [Ferrovibrio sp.]|uniref:ATP-dependent DNA helicase n=1 Tax=Ferrovibrio sp. TaxID=1917215 RepID=UPI0025C21532|nr:ATP-dependent DNA helicase [Ferrovibrio sp.]MBX3454844.1 ATP-dependent DNA helicase [Ferrovibrio sp.]